MYTFGFRDAKAASRGPQVVVTVGAAGASIGATTVPVTALSGPIPAGTTLNFGGAKLATLTADALAGATSLTVEELPAALVEDDTATFSGFGVPVDIPAVQMMSATIRVVTAEGTGDDRIVVTASRVIAGSAQCRMLGVSLDALGVVTGLPPIVTGSGATQVRTLALPGGHRFPSFALIGQALEEKDDEDPEAFGGGDELLFMPSVKVTSDITLGSFEYGAFQTVEFTVTATAHAQYDIINVIERATTGEYTLPPAGIVPVP